ncbi:MAG: diadenylate cyclase [Planctomycetes bacterium]|nr:diadenylate cyclase [Planctomycetota bacterium]
MDFASLRDGLGHFRLADAFDIGAVALLCYLGLSWLRQHASRPLLSAAIAVLLLYAGARLFNLYLTSLLFQAGAVVIAVALLLIFQDDLRRAAERLALRRTPAARAGTSSSTLDIIAETVHELAEARIGALLVFPGREPLERHTRGGEPLGGEISRSLLMSIFHSGSPGHDGAAVVEGSRLTRFALHLPLSRYPEKVGREGTRHAAAMGLAEQCDALVVVVSEERGTVSIAHRGTLEVIKPAALRERLGQFLEETAPKPAPQVVTRWLIREPGLKAISLLLACLLWLGLAYRVEPVERPATAIIEYRGLPPGWAIAEPRPSQVQLTLSGREREFDGFSPEDVVVSLDLSRPSEGTLEFALSDDQVTGAENLEILEIDPRIVRVQVFRVATLALPIEVPRENELPPDLVLTAIETQPATIHVQAPVAQADSLKAIATEPFDLSRLRSSKTVRLQLELPPRVRLVEGQPPVIEAAVQIDRRPLPAKKAG